MSDVPVQLIVAAFQDEQAADEALKALKQAKRERLIGIQNAAVIRKDEKGKLHIRETADLGGGRGAVLGGVAGAAIGLIAGPALVVPAAVGALVGGLTAKLKDSGFSDDRLRALGEGLTPGSSAIVAVIEHKWVDQVRKELEQAGADMVTAELQADIAAQLEAGHDVAYTAISAQEGFAAGRVAAGEDEVEGGSVVVTDDAVEGTQFVATQEGFAVRRMEASDEGVYVEGAVGTREGVAYGAALATDEGVVGGVITAPAEEEGEEGEEKPADA
jgi:uncharacterized membrane protein